MHNGFVGAAMALLLATVPTAALADCGWWDPLAACKAAEEAASAADAFGAMVDQKIGEVLKQLDKAVLAVPGERYLRLIDDLNDPNEQVRAGARAFLARLADVDVTAQYKFVVSAEFNDPVDPTVPFEFDARPLAINTDLAVKQWFATNSVSWTRPNSQMLRPLDRDAIYQAAVGHARFALEKLHSDDGLGRQNRPGFVYGWYRNYFNYEGVSVGEPDNPRVTDQMATNYMWPNEWEDRARTEFEQMAGGFADGIAQAVLATLTPVVPTNAAISDNFDPLATPPFIFVFIPKASFDNYASITVGIAVQDINDPSKTLNNRPTYTRTKQHFTAYEDPMYGTVYWTYVNAPGDLLLNENAWREQMLLSPQAAASD